MKTLRSIMRRVGIIVIRGLWFTCTHTKQIPDCLSRTSNRGSYRKSRALAPGGIIWSGEKQIIVLLSVFLGSAFYLFGISHSSFKPLFCGVSRMTLFLPPMKIRPLESRTIEFPSQLKSPPLRITSQRV